MPGTSTTKSASSRNADGTDVGPDPRLDTPCRKERALEQPCSGVFRGPGNAPEEPHNNGTVPFVLDPKPSASSSLTTWSAFHRTQCAFGVIWDGFGQIGNSSTDSGWIWPHLGRLDRVRCAFDRNWSGSDVDQLWPNSDFLGQHLAHFSRHRPESGRAFGIPTLIEPISGNNGDPW